MDENVVEPLAVEGTAETNEVATGACDDEIIPCAAEGRIAGFAGVVVEARAGAVAAS